MEDLLKNLAGNGVAIFLFRFESSGSGIGFVLNEAIAEDMYKDIDEKLQPLVHVCCETLLRYKHLSISNVIMDGNILHTGEFEVMLSKGLGRHFVEDEKQRLFQDAKNIADLLAAVMDRRTKKAKKGLEKLGQAKRLEAEVQRIVEREQIRPGLRQLRPEDLPPGVTASSGYDHRGHCYVFSHVTLGELGRIVLIKRGEDNMLMQAELCNEQESPPIKKKKEVFEEVVATINACFKENFG